jgi:hypothetical protein
VAHALIRAASPLLATPAVKGKQYICVMTGDNLAVPGLFGDTNFAGVTPEFKVPQGHNAIYEFRLP